MGLVLGRFANGSRWPDLFGAGVGLAGWESSVTVAEVLPHWCSQTRLTESGPIYGIWEMEFRPRWSFGSIKSMSRCNPAGCLARITTSWPLSFESQRCVNGWLMCGVSELYLRVSLRSCAKLLQLSQVGTTPTKGLGLWAMSESFYRSVVVAFSQAVVFLSSSMVRPADGTLMLGLFFLFGVWVAGAVATSRSTTSPAVRLVMGWREDRRPGLKRAA